MTVFTRIFLLCFLAVNTCFAWDLNLEDPQKIWLEYSGDYKPSTSRLQRLLEGFNPVEGFGISKPKEPYLTFILEELSKQLERSGTNKQLRDFSSVAPEPYSVLAWHILKPKAEKEDLIWLVRFGSGIIFKEAFEKLDTVSLTSNDLIDLTRGNLSQKILEKYAQIIWDRFFSENPTKEDFWYAFAESGVNEIKKKALVELMNRGFNYKPQEWRILGRNARALGYPEYEQIARIQFFLSASDEDLRIILASDPNYLYARQILESRSYYTKQKKEKELIRIILGQKTKPDQ